MSNLKGKAAIVTGASKGIGAGIAKALGAAGASVAVNYVSDKSGADEVVAEIARGGGKAVAIRGDLSAPADITRLFTEAKEAFGRLDVLVNNAGVYKFLPLDQSESEEFHRQFNINVLGTILAAREATRYFGPEGGSIINLSSVASRAAIPNSVIYSATKGAVDAVTRVLAAELGPRKIRVNALAPGMVETEGTTWPASSAANFTKRQKRQRHWAASASRTTSPASRSSSLPTRRAG
jgi:3-oxoacyl-[acyl-carrier protein] reductase